MWLLHNKQKIQKKQQALPSVITQTLAKATIFLFFGKSLCRVLLPRHSAKFGTLPSATSLALGKVPNFAECRSDSTRQRIKLRRVPNGNFAECITSGTWQKTHSHLFLPVTFTVRPSRLLYFAEWGLAHGKALPSVREMALGKACFAVR